MIRRLAMGLLLLPLLMVFGCASDLPTGVIAQVGTVPITQDQFDALKAAQEAAGKAPDKSRQPEEYRSFEQGLVDYLVTQEVMRQEASTFKVSIADQDVQAKVGQLKQMFQGDQDRFDAALKASGITLDQLTQSIRETLLVEKMKAAVTSGSTVTDQEAEAYYEAHKSQYVEQESREVRHILISPFRGADEGTASNEASQADWDAAKSEAEKVRSEIQNGADFATEAEKYSDDDGTKDKGGDMGPVTRGMLVPDFEEAVFSLKKNELSDPVKTPYGYHLIKVTDITPEQQLSYDQVMEKVKSSLLEEKRSAAWGQWLTSTETKLGVVYRKGFAPPSHPGTTVREQSTTTSGSESSTTTGQSETSTTGNSTTTATDGTTTTTAD